MIRFGVTCVAMVLVLTAAPAATQDPSPSLDAAEALLRRARYALAQPMFERALADARAANAQLDIARALIGLGEVAREGRRYAEARAAAQEGLAIAEQLGDDRRIADGLVVLAATERLTGNRPEALALIQRALPIAEAGGHQRALAEATYALILLQRLDLDAITALVERSAAAARAAGDPVKEGVSLHLLGDRMFAAARYEHSLELLSRAAAAFEAVDARVELGTVHNSIGRVYRAHGRFDQALKSQQAALALHREGGDPFTLLQSLNAVSVVYGFMGDTASERAYLQEAIEVGASMAPGPAVERAQDFLRANLAGTLLKLGDFARAAELLESVLASGRDSFPSLRYTQLSGAYRRLGRHQDALTAAERSLALCGQDKLACIGALNARANASAAASDRPAALRDLDETLRQLEELRGELVPSDYFKQDFSTAYRGYYASAMRIQLDAGLERESLATAELARARAFLDLLASRSIAPAVAAMPLRSPARTAAATPDDLISAAQRLKSTLLLYWVDETETFAWVVTPQGQVHARRVPVTRARLTALVRDTVPFAAGTTKSGTAAQPVLKDSTAAWRQLYTLLIEPVRAVLPRQPGALVTVVPHDVLANLSFAALQDARGRHLLEDYTLHYAPAGALLQFTSGERQSGRKGELLVVADPVPARRSNLDPTLPRLPGARAEADAIARHAGTKRTLTLHGNAATESAVRQYASSRGVLHFAAHAVIREDDPFASYLALTRSSNSADADGVLTADDIYRLSVPADLVVLSACRSAGGTVAGDGVAAFARAFVYAGAASLVASTWDVADEPSNRLLPEFYRAWLGGQSKAAALRQAQLRLLADLRAGRVTVTTPVGPVPVPEHPVFWAGFVVFGEPD